MQVVVRADQELGAIALAGRSSRARLEDLLESLNGPPSFLAAGEALPAGEETLFFQGWFPLLDPHELADFLQTARQGDGLRWGDTNSFIYYGREPEAAATAPSYDQTCPAPLARACDLGARNREAFQREADRLMNAGVLLLCPEQTFIEVGVLAEAGVMIAHGVTLAGRTRLARGARVDAGACLRDAEVGTGAHIKPYSVVEDAVIGEHASVGPFAHIRPGTRLGPEVRVGNFVETKKAVLGKGSKAGHLSYLGDTVIGEDCNIGAGTITCNYDGFNKSLTQLGNGVFIGSNSQLVAPVNIGDGGFVAAGSTVVENVPADALAIGRSRQVNKMGLAKKIRDKARRKKQAAQKEKDA